MPKLSLEQRIVKCFRKACSDFRLIENDDFILVALSGGKDSLCLLELLARQSRIYQPRFRVEAVHVRMENIQYKSNTSYLENFCVELGVRLHVLTTRFDVSPSATSEPLSKKKLHKQKTPCFLCSWNRRKQIFNLAQTLGCNKIALGHHMDDILHTALMNEFFQGRFEGMPVRLKMKKMPLTIIRPLCLCHEDAIKAYADERGYMKQVKHCPYEHDTHRRAIASLFKQVEQMNDEARFSLWNALQKAGKLVDDSLIVKDHP